MDRTIQIGGAVLAILTAIVGTTVAIDNRYAKSEEVKEQFCRARRQQLRDKIFEIDLKSPKTSNDKAMRDYLDQQLRDGC